MVEQQKEILVTKSNYSSRKSVKQNSGAKTNVNITFAGLMSWDRVNRGGLKPLEAIRSATLEMDGENQREIVVGENIGHTTTRAERLHDIVFEDSRWKASKESGDSATLSQAKNSGAAFNRENP